MTTPTNGYYVDADGHVRDPEPVIRKYLEAPFNRRLNLGANRTSFDPNMGGTLGIMELDAQVWLDLLDQGGVQTTVLYPTNLLNIGLLQEPDLAAAKCRAYNNFIYEEYLKVSPRFKAVALLPLREPSVAVAELSRCVTELGMVGGMLGDGPYLLGKPMFDPIYEEAQRLGCMLGLHGGGRLWGGIEEFLFDKFIQVSTIGNPFMQMRHFTSIMLEGVPEKFPELRLAFLEAGCSWVPFLLDRMDVKYRLRGKVEAPVLKKSPGEYFRQGNIYVGCEVNESLLSETVRILGEGVLLYATDIPHWDSDFPHSLHELLERGDLTEEQKSKIAGENARRLYDLS